MVATAAAQHASRRVRSVRILSEASPKRPPHRPSTVWAHEHETPVVRHPWRYDHERSCLPYFVRHPGFVRILAAMGAAGALWVRGLQEVRTYAAGEQLDVPGRPKVIFTPGHTHGHCSLDFHDRGAVYRGRRDRHAQSLCGGGGSSDSRRRGHRRQRSSPGVVGRLGIDPRGDAVVRARACPVFRSICFALWVSPMSATGRRPAQGRFSALGLGFRGRGSPPLSPRTPTSSTCQVNLEGQPRQQREQEGRGGGTRSERGRSEQGKDKRD